MNSLIKKIQTFSKRFDLWEKKSKIIVGVSGGPDSVCLLDILNKLKDKYNFEILVAHINYGLRGRDSVEDERFVKILTKRFELKFKKFKTSSFKIDDSNLESKLREIRFDFFEKIRKENNFDVVAIAHNQDDQAETVLMKMIRGAGLQGLGGIRPRNEKIIRPLLNTNRKEILNYLKENNLNYRIDSTNRDTKFFRNKIRHQLIPYLEKGYNPIIKKTLAKLAENISDDYDLITENAKKIIKQICSINKSKVEFSVQEIKKLHISLQKQVLRQSIFKIKKDLVDIENSHIEEILKIIKSQKNKSQKLYFKKLKVLRKGDIIQISI